jgi:hypothetical protein
MMHDCLADEPEWEAIAEVVPLELERRGLDRQVAGGGHAPVSL